MKLAQDLLADESCWCRGCFARDSTGKPVHWNSPDAVQWCALGAVYCCHIGKPTFQHLANFSRDFSGLIIANDDACKTHAEILELLRRFEAPLRMAYEEANPG